MVYNTEQTLSKCRWPLDPKSPALVHPLFWTPSPSIQLLSSCVFRNCPNMSKTKLCIFTSRPFVLPVFYVLVPPIVLHHPLSSFCIANAGSSRTRRRSSVGEWGELIVKTHNLCISLKKIFSVENSWQAMFHLFQVCISFLLFT